MSISYMSAGIVSGRAMSSAMEGIGRVSAISIANLSKVVTIICYSSLRLFHCASGLSIRLSLTDVLLTLNEGSLIQANNVIQTWEWLFIIYFVFLAASYLLLDLIALVTL